MLYHNGNAHSTQPHKVGKLSQHFQKKKGYHFHQSVELIYQLAFKCSLNWIVDLFTLIYLKCLKLLFLTLWLTVEWQYRQHFHNCTFFVFFFLPFHCCIDLDIIMVQELIAWFAYSLGNDLMNAGLFMIPNFIWEWFMNWWKVIYYAQ